MGSRPVGISASRGAAVLGISKYKTKFQAWQEIIAEIDPDFLESHGFSQPPGRVDPWKFEANGSPDSATAPLRWGLGLEIGLAEFLNLTDMEKVYKKNIGNCEITCHIDGIDDAGNLVEMKTANYLAWRSGWGDPGTGEIPIHYAVQILHQLICTGRDSARVVVAVLPGSQPELDRIFRISESGHVARGDDNFSSREFINRLDNLGMLYEYRITADPDAIEKMQIAYNEFHIENIKNRKPPGPENSTDLRCMIPAYAGEVEADERIHEIWCEYSGISAEISEAKKRQDALRSEIAKFMGSKTPERPAKSKKIELWHGSTKIATQSPTRFTISKKI